MKCVVCGVGPDTDPKGTAIHTTRPAGHPDRKWKHAACMTDEERSRIDPIALDITNIIERDNLKGA